MRLIRSVTPDELAVMFHQAYERLAPDFGYETRPETEVWDPYSPNGKLMRAVCGEILNDLANLK
jgi:hypothetical protein